MAIPYLLKRSARARTMRLSVYPDARVVVTVPVFSGAGTIERFVEKHSDWLRRKVAETARRNVISVSRKEVVALKKRALELAGERCMHFAKHYGFTYRKISIRAQKSRWGSCSSAGNLSFNYKIATLPSHIIDYVIIHELCHLVEMNHSRRFWVLVAKAVPDHRAVRKELRNTLVIFS